MNTPWQNGIIDVYVVSSNLVQAWCNSIEHNVIKFVSGFLRILWFPPPIKHHNSKP